MYRIWLLESHLKFVPPTLLWQEKQQQRARQSVLCIVHLPLRHLALLGDCSPWYLPPGHLPLPWSWSHSSFPAAGLSFLCVPSLYHVASPRLAAPLPQYCIVSSKVGLEPELQQPPVPCCTQIQYQAYFLPC